MHTTLQPPLQIDEYLSRLLFSNGLKPNISLVKHIVLLATVGQNRDLRVLLADDDQDDRDFFMEAVTEAVPSVRVSTVRDGEELIKTLLTADTLPDLVFLDLNMPIKNGWDCLTEIRANQRLQHLPVIIYSTSSNRAHIEETYHGGASMYIRKPDSYSDLKNIARKVFSLNWDSHARPSRDQYLLTA